MQRVTGIGGFFFRARDPDALSSWYAEHLGVTAPPEDVWRQAPGQTVWAPFPIDTDYFGDQTKSWMINFRVLDLDAMVAQLRAAGISVDVNAEDPHGRFARLADPEGNPIELWEPEDVT
jgi:glyoxylase I family protein